MTKQLIRQAWLPITFLGLILGLSLLSTTILHTLGYENSMDLSIKNLPPLSLTGLLGVLGTDELGKKLLPLMIHAGKYSLCISIISGILTTSLGLLIGLMSGFWGDRNLQIKRSSAIAAALSICTLIFYSFVISNLNSGSRQLMMVALNVTISILLFFSLNRLLSKIKWMKQAISVPVDMLGVKTIEVLVALPLYFVLLTLSALFTPSLIGLILIISLTSWPQTALLVRSEVLRIRELDFITSLKLLGVKNVRIIFRHVLPLASRPAIVNIAFIASSLLVVESTLSFIGIGLPDDVVSWGKILSQFKRNTTSWWIVLFPGLLTFASVLSLHKIGQTMTDLQKKYI